MAKCFNKFWILMAAALAHQIAVAQVDADLEAQVLGGAPSSEPAESRVPLTREAPDLSADAEAASDAEQDQVDRGDLAEIEGAVEGPEAIPYKHIFVVQRRLVRKEGRHEVSPLLLSIQPADSFRKQISFGFSYAYHLSDQWTFEPLHVSLIKNISSGLSDALTDSTGRETDRIEPVLGVAAALQWAPLRSKAAGVTSIHHFEGYFLGGGGMTRFEDETVASALVGLGFRLYVSRDALVRIEFRDSIDFRSSLEHRFNLLAGVGILLGSP